MMKDEQLSRQLSLLDWYDRNARVLPWRSDEPEPYRVWLSEIMLQQTTVTAVMPYFESFLNRWPDVASLAKADLDEVLHAWQGLGYYARARNLYKCAGHIVAEHGGRFPETEAELMKLPGIGAYTAGAIAAIAFGRKAAPVDGNILRVMSRLMRLDKPLPGVRDEAGTILADLVPEDRPGDFVQALMDLGSAICTPKRPRCQACPWENGCLSSATGDAERFPVRVPKRQKMVRHGVVFWMETEDHQILLRKRPERGLLGGMIEIPSTDWREGKWQLDEAMALAPAETSWEELAGEVRHTFTHFHLHLTVLAACVKPGNQYGGFFCPLDRLSEQALPSVMKKIVRLARPVPDQSS